MRRWLLHSFAALALPSTLACVEAPPPPSTPVTPPPGPDPVACAPGEALLEGGACLPAGVPAEACGEGFKSDGNGGCDAILPADPCPSGQMAAPGETACREVAPCGEGAFGDIPVEPNTRFVDASYAGNDSDGTADKPFTTIQSAIDDAEEGDIIAIAAGTYSEDLVIQYTTVRLWGRCPGMVEIAGAGGPAAITIAKGAHGTELRDIAVRGPDGGLLLSGSKDVVLDRVWIHDTGGRGVEVSDVLGETSLTVQRSLLENAREFGVIAVGVNLTLDAAVIRGTEPAVDQSFGRGLSVQINPGTERRAILSMKKSMVEANHEMGIFVLGSDASIDGSVVRDTKLAADQTFGRGITIRSDPDTKQRSTATVQASVIERNRESGMLILGSDVVIERTTIALTAPQGDQSGGRGIDIERDVDTGERANVTVRSSLVEDNIQFAIFVLASDAVIESTIARGTAVAADGVRGAGGINIQVDPDTKERASAEVRACLVEGNHEMGIFVSGADATIEATAVKNTLPGVEQLFGRGINVQTHPGTDERGVATIRSSLVDGSREMGILFLGSEGSIEQTIVRGTLPRESDGGFGDGVAVASFLGQPASCSIDGSHIESSARAGVASFGASLALGMTMVECNPIALNGEELNGSDFVFEDRGGNACGCADASDTCIVLSANLEPPTL